LESQQTAQIAGFLMVAGVEQSRKELYLHCSRERVRLPEVDDIGRKRLFLRALAIVYLDLTWWQHYNAHPFFGI